MINGEKQRMMSLSRDNILLALDKTSLPTVVIESKLMTKDQSSCFVFFSLLTDILTSTYSLHFIQEALVDAVFHILTSIFKAV